MKMSAVGELTFVHQLTHLRKTLSESLFLHIIKTELLDTRRVDNVTAERKREHLRKSSSMFSFLMNFRDVADTHIKRGV